MRSAEVVVTRGTVWLKRRGQVRLMNEWTRRSLLMEAWDEGVQKVSDEVAA